jgi:hypothetical protein
MFLEGTERLIMPEKIKRLKNSSICRVSPELLDENT